MNKLNKDKQTEIVKCLTEGMSLRATSRMTDVSRNTVSKLLLEIGEACERYHDERVKNFTTKKVQVDEIWSFIYSKQKNVPEAMKDQDGVGNVWTWTAIDADSKLIISYAVGNRDAECALRFMKDIKSRLANRVQLTSDGFGAYASAVEVAFQGEIDYGMLVKIYGAVSDEHRYSPAECTAAIKQPVTGRPVKKDISTSYVERQNLSMRMGMRRFTRLTNAFSKKMEYHVAAIALYFMHYNFVRIHQTLRCSPAMAAGIEKHLWKVEDIVELLYK
ncbi:MAG TPA: IS1 family transposase [Candidatus Kapabacteria bacterium]|nr:IS1 family transposase [Candidatus Kapabacteria bacterium]